MTRTTITVEGCKIETWTEDGKVYAQADECARRSFPPDTSFQAAAEAYLSGA